MTTGLAAASIFFLAMLLACGTLSRYDYAAEIEAWRTEREARLKAQTSAHLPIRVVTNLG